MNTLDKVYNLTIDIKNIDVKYNSYAKFFDDDRETSVIRIKLLNDKTPMNLENCIVEAYFILADNTYHNEACKIINSSEGVVELQLCQKCLVKGENIVRLSILKDNEISNTPVITYEVRKGLYSDNPSFNDDPLTPILSQMLLDIKVTKVNQIELQERYEKSLPKIEGKIKEVESLINRVDTVIASGTQDLEVKEARDGEVSLKARLDRDLYKDGMSLFDRIEAIEGLKDSQNMKYETDKGYLVCKETKNGVIDDLKIEGKTLVNLYKYGQVTINSNAQMTNIISNIKENTIYTIRLFGKTVGDSVILNNTNGTINGYTPKSLYTFNSGNNTEIKVYLTSCTIGEKINILILEGDHTQNPPSYFEGLMSVGQDVDKIEVLSRKEDGNLFDINSITRNKGIDQNLGIEISRSNGFISDYIRITDIGLDIRLNSAITAINRVAYYDKDKKCLGNGIYISENSLKELSVPHKTNACYIRFDGDLSYLSNIATKLKNTTEYLSYQSDKKQILFYNENGELKPIQELHEWDSIEKHSDNKWYYHKRSGKRSYQAEDENNSSYITDMTNTVYQLAEEEIYELAPLHLDSYANETLILCNSGAISPKMEFSITSHINELVKAYGERINLLEEKVYQYMVTQNRMQLASTYSADSVTFKVDYFSLCGDEENYDEDLYNLILNNILVGKDNYDYDKMFTMILDYASWNQISWEQFDILVGLMDIQHNPPVEELPTEDGIEEDIIENEETPVE